MAFLTDQVTTLAGAEIIDPDLGRIPPRPDQGSAHGAVGDRLTMSGAARSVQQRPGLPTALVDGADHHRQHREPLTSAGILNPRIQPTLGLLAVDLLLTDRGWATHGPHRLGSSTAQCARSR